MVRIDDLKIELSVSNMYYTYDGSLTENQASEMQEKSGYDPEGYGFFGYKVEGGETTWSSFTCCGDGLSD